MDIVKMQKMEMVSCGIDWDVIWKCICVGYYYQVVKYKGLGEYINLWMNLGVQFYFISVLYVGYLLDYVVYYELMFIFKVYVFIVMVVDFYWFVDLGGVFYLVKEKGFLI